MSTGFRYFTLPPALIAVFMFLTVMSPMPSYGEEPETVSSLMQKNFHSLVELQKYAIDVAKFKDPKNRAAIKAHLEQLRKNARHIPLLLQKKDLAGLAPIGAVYHDYIADIPKWYEAGHYGYARRAIGTATNFCMSCHTGMSQQKSFSALETQVDKLNLSLERKAEFYAATRQFDRALESYLKAIDQKFSIDWDLLDLTRTVKAALSIAVRQKEDPKLAANIIDRVLKKDLPEFVRHDFKRWKNDIAAWAGEKALPDSAPAKKFLERGRQLIKAAEELRQDFADHVSDIRVLRAINYINHAFHKGLKKKDRAEALYLLGTSYELLRDPLLWDLNQYYYEACIRELPHTQQAQTCFEHLSAELYFSYTGSRGTEVPWNERERLRNARELAY